MNVEEAQKLLAQSITKRRQWRNDAREDFAFVAGHQWSEEDEQTLDEAQRPRSTFNNIAPIADAVTGHEVANRQQVSYLPRQEGSANVNEVLTAAAEYVRQECDADSEESDAFYDMTVCGEGWTDTDIAYDVDLDGAINTGRVDPIEMDVDVNAVKKNHADARWLSRTRLYDRKEALELWPNGAFAPPNRSQGADAGQSPVNVIMAAFYRADSGAGGRQNNAPDKVAVHDFQYWEHETVYRVPLAQLGPERAFALFNEVDEKGTTLVPQKKMQPDEQGLITLDEAEYNRAKDLLEGVQCLKQKQRVYKRLYFSADEALEEKLCPVARGKYATFTYKAMTAKRDRKLKTWYGLVRAMKDPQKWANKFMSSMLEIIATSGKGGILYEPDAFLNIREAEEDWADPSRNVAMTDGAIAGNKIMPRPVSQMPPQMMSLMEYCEQSLRAVAGVNPEVMGLSQTLDPSGLMEEGRRQSGLNMLSYLFDALRRYRKENGRLLLAMIRTFIPQGRLIRIVGPEGMQYVPLVYDDLTVDFDVIVDEAPTAPNVKQRTWATFVQLATTMPNFITPPMAMAALDYSPFPSAMVQKLKGMAAAPPPPDPLKQAMLAEKTAGARDRNAAADLKLAQANALRQENAVKGMEAQLKARAGIAHDNAELATARMGFFTELAKYKAAVSKHDDDHAGRSFQHLQDLFATIEAAHGAHQAGLESVQAGHDTQRSAAETRAAIDQAENQPLPAQQSQQ